MGKKKKPKTQQEKLYEQNVQVPQSFEVPKMEKNKNFARIYQHMAENENFLSLSGNAVKIYIIMRTSIWKDINDYATTTTFDFSANKIDTEKTMSKKTCIRALRELEHYGFIRKENNATYQSGMTQRWSFSDEWSKRTYKKFEG